jgi:hypothetical protein
MAFKMKGSPMERNFGLGSIASKNKAGAMGIAGALGFGKNPMRKNKELPEGFYDSYKAADQKNVDGKTINMQQTKAASIKSGKFTPVYS